MDFRRLWKGSFFDGFRDRKKYTPNREKSEKSDPQGWPAGESEPRPRRREKGGKPPPRLRELGGSEAQKEIRFGGLERKKVRRFRKKEGSEVQRLRRK